MRATPFKQVLRDCARSQQIDPDSNYFTGDYMQQLAESIMSWFVPLYDREFWPFLMRVEQRQYRPSYDAATAYSAGAEVYYSSAYYRSMADANTGTTPGTDETKWLEVTEITNDDVDGYVWDPYIEWAQSGETEIPENGIEVDEFMFFESPSANKWARPVREIREDSTGIHAVADKHPVLPWIRFRPAAPKFTGVAYDDTVEYSAGEAVYDSATGECYKSLTDENAGNALTETAHWEKQLFPTVFMQVIRLHARAERLHVRGEDDKAVIYEGRAAAMADKLANDFYTQGGRTRRARVR